MMKTAKALKKDLEGIHTLGRTNLALKGRNGGIFWSLQDLQTMFDGGNHVIIVSKEGRRVVGFAIALTHVPIRFAMVTDFYVSDPYRNKGVPQKLMCELKDTLKRAGIRRTTFFLKMSNLEGNMRFFEKSGFVRASPFFLFEHQIPT